MESSEESREGSNDITVRMRAGHTGHTPNLALCYQGRLSWRREHQSQDPKVTRAKGLQAEGATSTDPEARGSLARVRKHEELRAAEAWEARQGAGEVGRTEPHALVCRTETLSLI